MDGQEVLQSANITRASLLEDLDKLTRAFPINSFWWDGQSYHWVRSIHMGDVIVRAITKRLEINPKAENGYQCATVESSLYVSDIGKVEEVDSDNYEAALIKLTRGITGKMHEIFQKQCLFHMHADPHITFTDFDKFYTGTQGIAHFFYEPTDNVYRVFTLDFTQYEGKNTTIEQWHFCLDNEKDNKIFMLSSKGPWSLGESSVFSGTGVYQITEYQFEELKKLIENNPLEDGRD